MKHPILILLTCVMLVACSKSDELVAPTNDSSSESTVVPLEKALERANEFFEGIQESKSTRASEKVVKKVEVISGRIKSRSTNDDANPEYYLVNYEGGGFALLGADVRLKSIYAISEEGEMNLSDTVYNKGLAQFIASLPDPKSNPNVDLPIVNPIKKATIIVSPMLHPNVRKWTQTTFNDYVEDKSPIDGTAVGCAVLATAQLLSYYKYPSSYSCLNNNYINETYQIDWDAVIRGENRDQICRLMEVLGRWPLFNVDYKLSGSYCGYNLADIVLRRFGYLNVNKSNFDKNAAINIIQSRNLILMVVKMVPKGSTDEIGHAFVIDGLSGLGFNTIFNPSTDYSEYYFHITWGWGGESDGYYYYDTVAKAFGPDSYPTQNGEDGHTNCTSYDKGEMYSNFVHN